MSLDELIIELQKIQAQQEDTDKMPVYFDNCYKVSNVDISQTTKGNNKYVDIY